MDVFDNFFDRGFGLPWRRGNYNRATFEVNSSCMLPGGVGLSSMPAPYSMKTLHVSNARPQEKIFIPENGARTQLPAYVAETEAAVTAAKIGDGYLVYCGDVNGEHGSDQTILALCGLQG